MTKKLDLPILMRDNDHEVVQVGTAAYRPRFGRITIRIDLDASAGGNMELFGQSVELGLVEALKLTPITSDFGIKAIEVLEAAEAEANEVPPDAAA